MWVRWVSSNYSSQQNYFGISKFIRKKMVKEFTVHGCHRMVDHHRSHLLQYAHRHVVDSRAHASNHHSHHHQSLRDLFEEQKYSIKKNSKRNSLTWKIVKEAYHGSVDHHRANHSAFASLVALDPVKIYHVVDIHGNLDGVWKNTNEKYITNLATLNSNPHVSYLSGQSSRPRRSSRRSER